MQSLNCCTAFQQACCTSFPCAFVYVRLTPCVTVCVLCVPRPQVKQAAVAALSELLPEGQRPLPLDLVRLSASSSCINPNGGPTWSSTGSEGNCQAVMNAADDIVSRLRPRLKVSLWEQPGHSTRTACRHTVRCGMMMGLADLILIPPGFSGTAWGLLVPLY